MINNSISPSRTIGVLTTSRADYSLILPLLRAIEAAPDLRLHLLVAGMHLIPEFGMTVRRIEDDGFTPAARIEMMLGSDSPEAIAKSMGLGTIGYAQSFAANRPDILVLQGDRFETHACAVAALPFRIPVAHLGGGDVTEGAIDDPLRHGITKLSHLHFAGGEEQASRIRQMGEEAWRVFVTGETGLDLIRTMPLMSSAEFASRFGACFSRPFLLVTYHPVTLEHDQTGRQIEALLGALDAAHLPVLFTAPNADTSGRIIAEAIQRYTKMHAESRLVESLGPEGYFSAMGLAAAMVGNSSSGIVEAASFRLPVVNIGTRQQGRLQPGNVVNSGYSQEEIAAAIERALSEDIRSSLADLQNPYGDGHACERIAEQLRKIPLDDKLIRKKFTRI